MPRISARVRGPAVRAAPVSHQKQPQRNATNAIEIKQKHSKINETDPYSAAHNGLVAGSSPAGPTSLRSQSEEGCRAKGEGGLLGLRATARQATHDQPAA